MQIQAALTGRQRMVQRHTGQIQTAPQTDAIEWFLALTANLSALLERITIEHSRRNTAKPAQNGSRARN